jgi:hypothetical protein
VAGADPLKLIRHYLAREVGSIALTAEVAEIQVAQVS